MRSSTARRASAVLLALLLGAVLTGCAGTSPSASPPPGSGTSTASASPDSSASPPGPSVPVKVPTSPAPATQEVTQLSLVLADGEVTGDTPIAQVRAGRPVRLTVTSDVADELHVHGVDETLELEPGKAAVLEFTPDFPGRFEVELHDARRVLTRLQVR